MKITTLAENTCPEKNLGFEHGLSLYIELEEKKILFDMGQTGLFADNAERLGIDLSEVDIAVLSHGHYDHAGGLARFLEINKKAPVYLSKYAFEPHYNHSEKFIGMNASLKSNKQLRFTDGVTEIGEGLTLYSCNDRRKNSDLGGFGLNVEREGKLLPDDFRHEQYLLINENGKTVLFSGCSHKGVINIVSWFEPDVLIGGFHFTELSPGRILTNCARRLDSHETIYYTCHCTGVEQYEFMKPLMRNLHYLSGGQVIEI